MEKVLSDELIENTTMTNIEPMTRGRVLYQQIDNMFTGKKKMNAYKEIMTWRKLGKEMLTYMRNMSRGMASVNKAYDRATKTTNDRAHKRWSTEEDELLIELLCDDDMSLIDVSTTLGRSVAAINTRCSQLVGIERKEQDIKGKFQGKLNGLIVDGTIDGVLKKCGV